MKRKMLCEGDCGRSFRNGERVYAVPTRITIVRGRREQFTVVDAYYCAPCSRTLGHVTLDASVVTAND
jgi:hypothetical protein